MLKIEHSFRLWPPMCIILRLCALHLHRQQSHYLHGNNQGLYEGVHRKPGLPGKIIVSCSYPLMRGYISKLSFHATAYCPLRVRECLTLFPKVRLTRWFSAALWGNDTGLRGNEHRLHRIMNTEYQSTVMSFSLLYSVLFFCWHPLYAFMYIFIWVGYCNSSCLGD